MKSTNGKSKQRPLRCELTSYKHSTSCVSLVLCGLNKKDSIMLLATISYIAITAHVYILHVLYDFTIKYYKRISI